MKKRILPALLALCMVMSLLPLTVFATDYYKCNCTHDGYDEGQKPSNCEQSTTIPEGQSKAEDKCAVCKADPKCTPQCTGNTETCTLKSETASDHKDGCEKFCTKNEDCTAKKAHQSGCPKEGTTPVVDTSKQECPQKNPKCVAYAVNGNHSRGCQFYCACVLNAAAEASELEEEPAPAKACPQHGESCTELVSTEGGLCTKCSANKTVADKKAEEAEEAEALAKRDCAAETNVKGSENCQKKVHEATCVASCAVVDEVSGCKLTAGHTENHQGSTCTKDTRCPAAAGTHDASCPNWKAGAETTETDKDGNKVTKRTGRTSYDFTLIVDCGCEDAHTKDNLHKDVVVSGSCAGTYDKATKTGGFSYKVTAYDEYEWVVVYGEDGKTEDKTATEANRAKAEADKKATLAETTEENQKKLLPDAKELICDYCVAAKAAQKVVDDADAYAKCNMSINCNATGTDEKGDPVNGKHKDDCLFLCTMSAACPNTEGDANAHRVKYRVMRSTVVCEEITVNKDGEVTGFVVDKTAKAVKDAPAVEIDFDIYAEARAYATMQDKYNEGKTELYSYAVYAIHCDKSGGVDSTVLTIEADGSVTETPEENDGPITDATKFTDMADWMVEGVQFMLDKKWMEGMGDGKFGGNDTLKTDMVLTVLARMNGETITGGTWAEDAKAWAEKNAEIFEGIDLSSDSMARKDVVLVLWRQAGKPDSTIELEFDDVDDLEGDHLTAMKWAVEKKIVVGNGDGTMTPDGNVTRAQLSLMTMRAFNNK